MRTCQECNDKYYSRGYCRPHYERYKREGKIKKLPKKDKEPCSNCKEKLENVKGLCEICYSRQWYTKNRDLVNFRNKNRKLQPKYRYHELKRSGKKRNCEVLITMDEYLDFMSVNSHCYYCNLDLNTERGASLDRIDNNKGYSLDNVLPCCSSCNATRGNRFTVEEMKIMINALLEHRSKINEAS